MTVPAFQVNAFQNNAFQTQTRRPTFPSVLVRESIQFEVVKPLKRHKAGTEIYIEVEVRDGSDFPPFLFNPTGAPELTLRNPSGTIVVDTDAMSNVEVGRYRYFYQSDAADPKGVYTAEFKAINGVAEGFSIAVGAFILV